MTHIAFPSGTGLVSFHPTATTVDVEPGAPLARHLPAPSAPPAAAAALFSRQPPRARRAAVARILGG